jgi:hypothetical protein
MVRIWSPPTAEGVGFTVGYGSWYSSINLTVGKLSKHNRGIDVFEL